MCSVPRCRGLARGRVYNLKNCEHGQQSAASAGGLTEDEASGGACGPPGRGLLELGSPSGRQNRFWQRRRAIPAPCHTPAPPRPLLASQTVPPREPPCCRATRYRAGRPRFGGLLTLDLGGLGIHCAHRPAPSVTSSLPCPPRAPTGQRSWSGLLLQGACRTCDPGRVLRLMGGRAERGTVCG